MSILFFIGIIIIFFLPFILSVSSKNEKYRVDRENVLNHIDSLPDFKCVQKEIGINTLGKIDKAIAIDEENKKLVLITITEKEYVNRFVDFDEVISVEVTEDEVSVGKYSKSGAFMGGVIAGIPGAVIGGLGNKNGKIKKLGIKIIINSILDPEFIFYSINSRNAIDKKGITYNSSKNIINKWHGIITVVIKRGLATV